MPDTSMFHILETGIPVHPKSGDHPVTYQFSIGENHYFCFANPQMLYYERFLAVQDRLLEAENRVTRDYLLDMCAIAEQYMNKGEFSAVAALHFNLKQRLEYLPSAEHLYALCSVWFFDLYESPFTYDSVYAYAKIALWQQHKDALAFFLRTDMQRFFPSWDGLQENFLNYSRVLAKMDSESLTYHLQQLSEIGAAPATVRRLGSSAERLRNLEQSLQ